MKRLVFVSLDFYPDDQSVSQLFTDLMLRLADHAHVTVLCGFPMGTTTGAEREIPRRERFGGVEIVRCGVRVHDKRKLVHRAVLYGSFLLDAGWKLVRLGRGSTVFGVTSPPFAAQLLWLTSRIARFRYQYMFLDVYPRLLFGLGKLQPSSPVARLWMRLNRLSYRAAERLIVLGRDMIPMLEQDYGIDPARVTYIPHWSAAETQSPPAFEDNPLAERLGLQGKFVVQYSGNMGLLHDIDGFVQAADRLRDDEHIHFLFIGKGRRRRAAEELAQSLNLTNITWLDFVPRERLRETLACCHAALISLRAGMEGVAVPSKLYGILAFGRAVLAQVPRDSEIAYAVSEDRSGRVVDPGDVDGMTEAIRHLASDHRLTEQMGRNAFTAYRSKYTIDKAVAAFRELWGLD